MGLFNKKKKQQLIELEKEFDYNKMMDAAKEAKIKEDADKMIIASKLENNLEQEEEVDLMMTVAKVKDLLKQSTVTFVNKVIDGYSPSKTETNRLGIYDRNNNLILVLTYDLDEKMLFRYMVNYYMDNYGINDVDFSLKLIKPVFILTDLNIKGLPIEFILAYLSIHLFSNQSNFNDFFDMCFFSGTLQNTANQYNVKYK